MAVFNADVEYEKLPLFCSTCYVINHSLNNTRKLIFLKDKINMKRRLQQKKMKSVLVLEAAPLFQIVSTPFR